MQEDARGGLDEVRAEVERVGLRQRDPEAVRVHGAQMGRVPVGEPRESRAHRAVPRRHVRWCRPVVAHARRGGVQAAGVQERGPVGAVEEHVGTVVADGAPRLDEEVRPARVVGVGAEPRRVRDGGPGQREVALRGWRHGPEMVAPGPDAQRLAPLGCVVGEVSRREVAVPELEQAAAELAAVEAVAPVARHGAQGAGDAGDAHALPDLERPTGAELAGSRERVDEVTRQRQHDGGRKAVLGQLDRRGQHVAEREPAVAGVQGQPTVHGAGHLDAADVAPQRHGRHALGAHAGRVGPGTGTPDGEERLWC